MNTFIYTQNFSFPGNYIYDPGVIFSNRMREQFNEKQERSLPESTREHKKTVTLIMADDDEDDRELFKEALQFSRADVNLEFAVDGQCLLDILQKCKEIPDLIFLDLNMPHKSGLECLEEIRKHDRLKDIPVVIYSTSSSQKDINDTFDIGANLYVKKPNSFHELQLITNKVLSLNWNKYKPHAIRSLFLFSSKTE